MDDNIYWRILVVMVPFSLLSLGGGPSIFGPMQHQAVDIQHWMTGRQFLDLFAVARTAPGPGTMLATLVGLKAAGWGGAVVATLALFVPSSILCYAVSLGWTRYRGHRWHTALEAGLAPIGAGLILGGSVTIVRLMGGGAITWLLTGAVAAILFWRPKLHPLLIMAVGGVVVVAVHAAGGPT